MSWSNVEAQESHDPRDAAAQMETQDSKLHSRLWGHLHQAVNLSWLDIPSGTFIKFVNVVFLIFLRSGIHRAD
jgi:hypothetical protein